MTAYSIGEREGILDSVYRLLTRSGSCLGLVVDCIKLSKVSRSRRVDIASITKSGEDQSNMKMEKKRGLNPKV